MKRFVALFTLCCLLASSAALAGGRKMIPRYNRLTHQWMDYPAATIREIQQVPLDSLLLADTLQLSNQKRWTLQASPLLGDTVVITAVVVVPAKVITFTQKGFTMLLRDPDPNQTEWSGIFVRCSSDTTTHIADGFMNPVPGNVVLMTGVVSEYPSPNQMASGTQFQPIPGIAVDIIDNVPVPPAIPKTVGDFYRGVWPGTVQFSTGEPYEGMVVELTNVTVDTRVNNSRGTFSMVDAQGNQLAMLDASRYFTLGSATDHPFGADPIWKVTYPTVVGRQIDTIRGFLICNSGMENSRGYRICPIYYGDIIWGKTLPAITTHRRYPVIVSPDSTPLVTVKSYTQDPMLSIASVVLYYSVNNGPFIADSMVYQPTDSTYRTTIPPQSVGTFVRYFIKAADTDSNPAPNTRILASAASGGAAYDTSRGFFFYTVTPSSQSLTIHEVQWTPYLNGRSPYVGSVASVSGIVTVDTSSMGVLGRSGWTNAWYMQSGTQPWSGVWMVGPDTLMGKMQLGDSVTVTGKITENYDVTRIDTVSSLVIHSSGNPVPPPVDLTTGRFGAAAGNGNQNAEPYEGMLVRFTNVMVTDINPTYSDPTEYAVDDGSGAVLVQHGGTNTFTNVPGDTIGLTLLHVGDRISTLTGIVYYSYQRYKFVPRSNADFGTITEGIEDLRGAVLPANYALSNNYPNPFNPTTKLNLHLPEAAHVEVSVYNVIGQHVVTLVNENRAAGRLTVTWDGTDQRGVPVNSGVYFVRMHARPTNNQSGEFTSVQKVMLLK